MNSEELRVKVATLVGWKDIEPLMRAEGALFGKRFIERYQEWSAAIPLPDYPNSLDAMHEAEKTLTAKEWARYVVALARVIAGATNGEKVRVPTNVLISATALQRARAFVAVKEDATI